MRARVAGRRASGKVYRREGTEDGVRGGKRHVTRKRRVTVSRKGAEEKRRTSINQAAQGRQPVWVGGGGVSLRTGTAYPGDTQVRDKAQEKKKLST